MTVFNRCFLCAALLAATLASLSQYRPAWAENTGLDWWNLPELRERARAGERWSAGAEESGRRLVARTAAKAGVIAELRAGRLTLAEAAARFRGLNAPIEGVVDGPSLLYPDGPPDERLCRQVIFWASAGPGSPAEAERIRARLEAELRRLRDANDGTVALPQ